MLFDNTDDYLGGLMIEDHVVDVIERKFDNSAAKKIKSMLSDGYKISQLDTNTIKPWIELCCVNNNTMQIVTITKNNNVSVTHKKRNRSD